MLDRLSGVFAQLFNISSLFPQEEFTTIQTDIFPMWISSSSNDPNDPNIAQQVENKFGIELVGTFFLGDVEGFAIGPLKPEVDFTSSTNNGNEFFVGNVTGDVPSPSGVLFADWQQMNATSGGLANQVFLIETVGGGPGSSSVSISRSQAAAVARS